jgi:hypothetical protein
VSLADAVVGSKIHLLVFDCATAARRRRCLVQAPLAVHADGDAVIGERAGEGRTGKLRVLIRVEDLRLACFALDKYGQGLRELLPGGQPATPSRPLIVLCRFSGPALTARSIQSGS